jgi:hypothetical protein
VCGETLGRWETKGQEKVSLLHRNTLLYAVNHYTRVLLKNFTTKSLGAHVLWAVRYLRTAAGLDWFPVKKMFYATVDKKLGLAALFAEVCLLFLASSGMPCIACANASRRYIT